MTDSLEPVGLKESTHWIHGSRWEKQYDWTKGLNVKPQSNSRFIACVGARRHWVGNCGSPPGLDRVQGTPHNGCQGPLCSGGRPRRNHDHIFLRILYSDNQFGREPVTTRALNGTDWVHLWRATPKQSLRTRSSGSTGFQKVGRRLTLASDSMTRNGLEPERRTFDCCGRFAALQVSILIKED